ncbi:DUF962-domain-containing protein [Phlyctochytrium arcticum]|nr:DUF962-domain-containing protein [Phlyctochytrium arcticum]
MSGGGVFDFEHQLKQYGQYHNNKINQLVHVIFVPTILWTVLVWLTSTGEFAHWALSDVLPINGALVVITVYNLYYILLEPLAGLLYTPLLFGMCAYANTFAAKPEVWGTSPMLAVTAMHVASWIMQFAGHGFAEKRAPALLDNLLQAFALAPFFVFIEVLFRVGYRPALRKRLDASIEEAVRNWKKAQGKKRT